MRPRLSLRERQAIAQSEVFVCLVTRAWLRDPHTQAQAAYAQQLGKPMRLLRWPGVHLPEDLLARVQDLQTAPHTTEAGDAAQIQRWLEAYRREEAP